MISKNKLLIGILTGVLIVILTACGASETNNDDQMNSGSGVNLAGTSWRLVSFGEPGSETPVIDGSEITLIFEVGNQAVGSGGCNSYNAGYTVSDQELTFSEIISTLIACADESLTLQEQAYFAALQSSSEFEMTNGQLKIWYNDGQQVLNFESNE